MAPGWSTTSTPPSLITALPCTLAVFTTLFGLGALFANRIPAIDEFTLFACFGMLSLLCVMLTLLPLKGWRRAIAPSQSIPACE